MLMAVPIALVFGGTLLAAPPQQEAAPGQGWSIRQMPPAERGAVAVRNIVAPGPGVAKALAVAIGDLCGADTTAPVRFAAGIPAPQGGDEPEPRILAAFWPQDIGGLRAMLAGPILAKDASSAPDPALREARWCGSVDDASPAPPVPTMAKTSSALDPTVEEMVCCHLRARELLRACRQPDGTPREGLDAAARSDITANALKCNDACVMATADPLVLCARFENLDAVRVAMLCLNERADAEDCRLDMLQLATMCGANALVERVVALADDARPPTPLTADDGWPVLAWPFVDACDRFRQVQASNGRIMERAARECAKELGYQGDDATIIHRGFAAVVPYLPLGRALPGNTPQRAVEIAKERFPGIPNRTQAESMAYTVPWIIYGHEWSGEGVMPPSEARLRRFAHALIMDEMRNGVESLMTKVPADFVAEARAKAVESEQRLSAQLADSWLPESVFCPDPSRLREVRSHIRREMAGSVREQEWEMDPREEAIHRINAVVRDIDFELGAERALERPTRLTPFRDVSAGFRGPPRLNLHPGQLCLDLSKAGKQP
jgi:hypothetical protein